MAAREEERPRDPRDLHDGPAAVLTFQAGRLATIAGTDPHRTTALA